MYPKNAWYVARTPDEIAGCPGRTICGGRSCSPSRARSGRRAGRLLPPTGARAVAGHGAKAICNAATTACGWNAPGKSVSMPGQRARFPGAQLSGVERYGFIWCVARTPTRPTPATIHHLPPGQQPEGPTAAAAPHCLRLPPDDRQPDGPDARDPCAPTSIGQKEIDEAPCKTRVEGDEVITSRFMEGIEAPILKMALRMNGLPDDQLVDRWQICHFTPPAMC